MIKRLSDYSFVIAGAPGLKESDYDLAIKAGVKVEFGLTRELLTKAQAAIITSGTATLEAALLGTRQVVTYKTGLFNYAIAKFVVNVKHISLPNLILGREIVPELIQGDCTADNIVKNLKVVLQDGKQIEGYEEVRIALGNKGASKRIANYIIKDSSSS